MIVEAALALGANMGDPAANIAEAVRRLAAVPGLALVAASSLYRTAPWGVTDQPAFLNAALLARTSLAPRGLLANTQAIERAMGREPGLRWGPRPIDIDLLWVGDAVVADADLTLPHPGLFERGFVLLPLAEIAGERVLAGRSIGEAARGFGAGEIAAPPPRF